MPTKTDCARKLKEYGVYIQRTPTRTYHIGLVNGPPLASFATFEDAYKAFEDAVEYFWDAHAEAFNHDVKRYLAIHNR